jgi:prolyl 4-hydroxylase
MQSALDQEWQDWLSENLSRQCDPVDLYNTMRKNGFAVDTIRQWMGDAYPVGIDAPQSSSDIDYQALAAVVEHNGMQARAQRFETDLLQLYTIEAFLSPEECEKIISIAEDGLQPSLVTHSNGDNAFRTSETCHLDSSGDPFVKYIDEKIAKCLGVTLPYSEPIQAQSYRVGQEFKAHHDYFAADAEIYKKFAEKAGQRTWTFTIYLNDVPQGGGTHFPYINHTFYPKQGMAAIWNNLFSDGTPNRNTLHSGMPVEEGRKVIITKWFREKGYGPMFYDPAPGSAEALS